MNPLQIITLVAGAVGGVLTQLTPILPEGKAKTWVTMGSMFLTGLAINVFKRKPGQ